MRLREFSEKAAIDLENTKIPLYNTGQDKAYCFDCGVEYLSFYGFSKMPAKVKKSEKAIQANRNPGPQKKVTRKGKGKKTINY